MIDALRVGASVDHPARVASRLERARHVAPASPDDLEEVTGYVGTLRARLRGDRLLLRGSLPAYMDSTSPLLRLGVADARRRIEDALETDLRDAHVWGAELTRDLCLSRPVASYLPLLLRRPRTQRVVYEWETVSFRTGARWLTFYDVAARAQAQKKPPPVGNVLRVELKYVKRFGRQIGADGPVTFGDLSESTLWTHLVGRWIQEYERVEKARPALPLDGASDLRRQLERAGAEAVGVASVSASVREAIGAGHLSRSTGYDRLRRVRDLLADPALTVEDERAAELDEAVQDAARQALA